MYGETFYGRHTAQHQLQWSQIKSEVRSFKSNENIHKKEGGSYYDSNRPAQRHKLTRVCGCAGWSVPLLFAYSKNRFSHDDAQLIEYWQYLG